MCGIVGTKKRILSSLFLLAVFSVVTVYAQSEVKPLQTEFVRLNNLEVRDENDVHRLGKGGVFLFEIVKPLLSKRGAFEIEKRGNTLIVTDTKGRVKLITEFVRTLDESGLSIDYLTSEKESGEKTINEIVKTKHIFPVLFCFVGEDQPLWAQTQGRLLIKPIKIIKAKIKINGKDAELSGTVKQVGLAKKIIALFDEPFLTDEED